MPSPEQIYSGSVRVLSLAFIGIGVALVVVTLGAGGGPVSLGLLMGIVLVGNAVAVRHLPIESVPGILRGRVLMCNRMRPWLTAAAAAMTATGIFLLLLG